MINQLTEIENDIVKFWIKNDILFSEYKKPFHMTLENSITIYDLRKDISQGKDWLYCYDATNLKSMNKSTRDYGEKYGHENIKTAAVIINSSLVKYLYNTYTKRKSVNFPIQAFKSKNEVVEWLKNLKI